MELESKAEAFTTTLARPSAEALLGVAELGLRLIEADGSVQTPASTAQALKEMRRQIAGGRGRAVDLTLTRTDASLIERAADKAIRLAPVFNHAIPDSATVALTALRDGSGRADPTPKWLPPRRKRR